MPLRSFLRTPSEHGHHRVTYVELLFDLVFVFAIRCRAMEFRTHFGFLRLHAYGMPQIVHAPRRGRTLPKSGMMKREAIWRSSGGSPNSAASATPVRRQPTSSTPAPVSQARKPEAAEREA